METARLIGMLLSLDFTGTAAASKMRANAEKYPVEKARGNARKYTDL